MSFIVLDMFNPEIVNVVCDEEGNTLFFDTIKEAEKCAEGEQEPLIVNLDDGRAVTRRCENVLLNVVVLPFHSGVNKNGPVLGAVNRLYLNGKYITRYMEERSTDYTITWDGYCDIIGGLKLAMPGLRVKGILLPESALFSLLGADWDKDGFDSPRVWSAIAEKYGLQDIDSD